MVDLPRRVLRPFLGARIMKTGLAVFLSIAAFHWVGSSYGAYAGVSAVLAVQPSVARVRQLLLQQMLSNLIGGLVGALIGLWLGAHPVSMALAAILVLGLCSAFRLNETAGSAVVAVLFIMDNQHDFLRYTGSRMGAVLGGMLIGYLVNRYVRPPRFTMRVRDQLGDAAEGVDTFTTHLLTSLEAPDHFRKEQIKAEAAAIQRRTETAGYYLDLHQEAHPEDPHILPMAKAKGSLFVFVERIMDIHKVLLQMGGLQPGAEVTAVSGALKAVLRFKQDMIQSTLDRHAPDPVKAAAYAEALSALDRLVEQLVADPEHRSRGLALHGISINIRHMGWRMESLARLLQAELNS